MLVHIFDAISRDQRVVRETEDELEVEYISGAESEDSDGGWKKKKSAKNSIDNRAMIIYLFTTAADGRSVRIEVSGFRPFFFVELPTECKTVTDEQRVKGKIEEKVLANFKKSEKQIGFELVHRQKLIGYTGGRSFAFLKISVPSLGMFYEARKLFLDEHQKPKLKIAGMGSQPLRVFESNIDPMLRFFHLRDIQPCGWVSVDGVDLEDLEDDGTGTLKAQAEWTDVSAGVAPEGVVTAPFNHAFWDIECYSHDGDFPVAQQGYRRVAKQLWIYATKAEDIAELLVEAFEQPDQATTLIKIPPLKQEVKAYEGKRPIPIQGESKTQTIKVYCSDRREDVEFTHTTKSWARPQAKEIRAACKANLANFQEIWAGKASVTGKEREARIQALTKVLDKAFGRLAPIAGDPIIQIGTVVARGKQPLKRHIFVLKGCADVPGAIVHTFNTEKEMLVSWFQWLCTCNFDVFVGYNTSGFDERYVWDRLVELGLEQEEVVQQQTRLWDQGGQMKLEEKFLSSSALGDNMLYMWSTPGRLHIDLYSHIKRKVQMASYKLDAVCAAFLSGKLSGIQGLGEGRWLLKTKQKGDAKVGRYVQVLDEMGEDLTEKMAIVEITDHGLVVQSEEDLTVIAGEAVKWAVVKDDVSPQEIFRLHRGDDQDRARVASYCVQDCELVYELYKKLEVFNEAMSMANVCSVPVNYIFVRGQGIKIESLIFKDCMLKGQLIEVLPAAAFGPGQGHGDAPQQQEDSYEGAIVLDPEPGFYTEAPVGVCDFASLYPSTIISENISHDMLVWTKDYTLDGKFIQLKYGSDEAELAAPPGTRFTDIEFDIWRPDPEDKRKTPRKIKAGIRICRYAQPPNDVKGSLPQIVGKLLAARKAKRAEITKTDDPFKKALLDAEQNAYKITANSLYGQLGSRTFKIRLQDLAASVTAYGRKQIMFSKSAIEEFYGPAAADPRCSAKIVYGDTDSLFVCFNPRNPATGERYQGREAIVKTIELTEEAGKFISGALKAPHDFEYDKVFYPFIIFSKKRYVGNKYEESPDEFKETSMGIVLKRRDNAPLLKMTYGAAIDCLLNRRDVAGAVEAGKRGCGILWKGA
jgi:DNA polymerase elongation subunit (family B)